MLMWDWTEDTLHDLALASSITCMALCMIARLEPVKVSLRTMLIVSSKLVALLLYHLISLRFVHLIISVSSNNSIKSFSFLKVVVNLSINFRLFMLFLCMEDENLLMMFRAWAFLFLLCWYVATIYSLCVTGCLNDNRLLFLEGKLSTSSSGIVNHFCWMSLRVH